MELTITGSTSSERGPINDLKSVAGAEKHFESMVYRLTQERGRWPFRTPRLKNGTKKNEGERPSPDQAEIGVSGRSTRDLREEVYDGEDVRYVSKGDHYRRLLTRTYEVRTEDQENT